MLPMAGHAVAKYQIDGIYYYLYYSNKTAQVTYKSRDSYKGDIVIPSTVTLDDVFS